METEAGTLYVVGTPIGNLGDVSRRASEVLTAVDRICAEDTRRTRALLSHLGIRAKALSKLDAHAGDIAVDKVVTELKNGQSVAVVTDAGMPSVSDPGSRLVSACHAEAIPVQSVPGPSAVTTAVSLSGLVEDKFLFLGFIPRSGKKRQAVLERIRDSDVPVVLFESPNRAQALFQDLSTIAEDRPVAAARELTKLHEEVRLKTAREHAQCDAWRGELTVVIAAAPIPEDTRDLTEDADLKAQIRIAVEAGAGKNALAQGLAKQLGRPKRELYQLILSLSTDR